MTPENRVKRLKALIAEFKKKGLKTYASLESKYGVNASYISQLINGKRSFGETAARKMEVQFGLDEYYFERADDEIDLDDVLNQGSISPVPNETDIAIPVYAVYFCCGDGNDAQFGFEEIKGHRHIPADFFSNHNIKPDDFKLVCANNDSMAPYINDKDEVGIVITDTEIRDGDVYAILLDGDRMFKQIFKEAGNTLRLRSFNSAYPDKIVTEDNHDSIKIVGKQVYRAG